MDDDVRSKIFTIEIWILNIFIVFLYPIKNIKNCLYSLWSYYPYKEKDTM